MTLSGLSFAPGTSAFDVYRGTTPAQLFRIASDQALAAQFTDTGLADQLVAPPDSNFDHANFYWRMELQPESGVTLHSATTVGNGSLQMTANRYQSMIARITRGTGAGQERAIAANDATSLTIAPPWSVEPDATSFFVVAETGWQFGALTTSSPVQFEVPNRSGEVVHLTGRAANVNNVECAPEISTVTRWQIGGGGTGDSDVPPMPFFGLGPGQGGGTVELSGVSFTDLTNTRTISAATLTMYYWDELQGTPAITLASAVGTGDTLLSLSAAGSAQPGSYIQIELEVIRVEAVENNGTEYSVTRAMDGSQAAAHAAQTPVYPLLSKTVIAPFPPEFFGSPYSGSWSYPIALPDVRVASAELFVTNQQGNSPTQDICLTHTTDSGLRTLSGGQYSIQVDGYLAVDQSVAPALVMEASHSVRDVYAVLGTAADAAVGLQLNVNGASYCQLTIRRVGDGFEHRGRQYTGPAAIGRAGDAVRAVGGIDRSRLGPHRHHPTLMPDQLSKLRPDRDLQCYFQEPSAVAALSGTSPSGFTVSGCWRQQFDWVVVEWNRDNVFEHPALRNLPDGDLSGLHLSYEETRTNCIPLDSTTYDSISWSYLRIWEESNNTENFHRVPLLQYAVAADGSYAQPTVVFEFQGTPVAGDIVGLAWLDQYPNYWVVAGNSAADVASGLAANINAQTSTSNVSASANGSQITLTYNGAPGANGNRVGVYGWVYSPNNGTGAWSPSWAMFQGGTSPDRWRVTLDFSNLKDEFGNTVTTTNVRKLRWTWAADLQFGNFARSEFAVVVTNWQVTGTNLAVSGCGAGQPED